MSIETEAQKLAQAAARTPQILTSVEEFREVCTRLSQDVPSVTNEGTALFLGPRAVIWLDAIPAEEFHVTDRARGVLLPEHFSFILNLRPLGQTRRPQPVLAFLADEIDPRRSAARFLWAATAAVAGIATVYWADMATVANLTTGLLVVLTALTSIGVVLASSVTTSLPALAPIMVTTRTFHEAVRTDRNILVVSGAALILSLVATTLAHLWQTSTAGYLLLFVAPETENIPLSEWQSTALFAALIIPGIWATGWLTFSAFPYYGARNAGMLASRGLDEYRAGRRVPGGDN